MSNNIMMFSTENAGGIPKLEKDVANIQKLPREPRTGNGWPWKVFQEEFDKAGIDIKEYLNTILIPALISRNIPFAPTTGIPCNNIQDALEEVQKQIKESIAGSIPNGTIDAEKLTQALFDRVYGGRPWVSLDAPTSSDNTGAGFPIGQLWVRPGYTMTNLNKDTWAGSGCTVQISGGATTVTGNKNLAVMEATQTFAAAGNSGDAVYILFDLESIDPEIVSVKASVNAAPSEPVSSGPVVLSGTILDGGTLTVSVSAEYPTPTVADGSFTMRNVTVVNAGAIRRRFTAAKDSKDWAALIKAYIPFKSALVPFTGWSHIRSGVWTEFTWDTVPADRGGTGFNSYGKGAVLYADSENTLAQAPNSGTPGALVTEGSTPRWANGDDTAKLLGFTRCITGTYVGDAAGKRTIDLPVTPKMICVYAEDGPDMGFGGGGPYDSTPYISDEPITLANGTISAEPFSFKYMHYDDERVAYGLSSVKLNGNKLEISGQVKTNYSDYVPPRTTLCNRSGVKYNWTAIY